MDSKLLAFVESFPFQVHHKHFKDILKEDASHGAASKLAPAPSCTVPVCCLTNAQILIPILSAFDCWPNSDHLRLTAKVRATALGVLVLVTAAFKSQVEVDNKSRG